MEAIERGLFVLALSGTNAGRASKQLAEQGMSIPPATLRRWANETHSERYAAIRDEHAAEVQKRVAREQEDIAIKAAAVTAKLLDRLDAEVDTLDKRDLSTAARNTGTIGGIAVSRLMETRERPLPARAPDRDLDAIFRALREISPSLIVDDPPPDAEAVDVDVPAIPQRTKEQSP
jgi:hypothetical protein